MPKGMEPIVLAYQNVPCIKVRTTGTCRTEMFERLVVSQGKSIPESSFVQYKTMAF